MFTDYKPSIHQLQYWLLQTGRCVCCGKRLHEADEAPRVETRGIFSSLLRRERNPAEAENTLHSFLRLRSGFSAKEDKERKNGSFLLTCICRRVFVWHPVENVYRRAYLEDLRK